MGKKSSSVKFGSVLEKYAQFITPISELEEKPYMSLGPLSINLAVGDPRGVPMGKMVQLVGRQSSGKSSLALDIAAQYQKAHSDESVLYVDFERSLDPKYVAACGVDTSRLLRVAPNVTEEGFDIVETAIKGGEIKLVIIDSVAAARSSTEEDKGYGDNMKMASSATIMSRFCTRMIGVLDNENASVILINQLRKNFSLMSREEEIPFGGMSLQYAVNVSIQLARIKTENTKQIVQAIIKKNKVGSPQQRVEFTLEYGKGIDHAEDIITLGISMGAVTQRGAWYTFENFNVQGITKAAEQFPLDRIRTTILDRIANKI